MYFLASKVVQKIFKISAKCCQYIHTTAITARCQHIAVHCGNLANADVAIAVANAVWILSESESLKRPSNSCSAFTSAFKGLKAAEIAAKKRK